MLIDHTHRRWFMGSAVGLAAAIAIYIPYSVHSPQGSRGGSALGLVYGSVGFVFMLFAGLLGLRKKFPIWRVGRAQTWMRGHLWLGAVSLPLILMHGGFHFGGTLPRFHTARLPMETIYEEIDHVRQQLLQEATKLVEETRAAVEGDVSSASERQRALAAAAGANWDVTVASGLQVDYEASVELDRFLHAEIEPFLSHAGSGRNRLSNPPLARAMFQQLRLLFPANLHANIDDLENICDEKRQQDEQRRLHKILHGWLLVHIPLSYT